MHRPTNPKRPSPIALHSLSARATRGLLRLGAIGIPCAVGRSGLACLKREGDRKTPRGTLTPLSVRYRDDRVRRPLSALPTLPTRTRHGWCDDPSDRNYNRPITLPYPASSETMTRTDNLYDIVVVLDYNYRRRVRYRGSAIFLHLATRGYTPTEGCIAVKEPHMRLLLKALGRHGCIFTRCR